MAAIAFQPETSNNLKWPGEKLNAGISYCHCGHIAVHSWIDSHCSEAPMSSFSRQVVPGFDKAVRGLKAGDLAGMHCRL